MELKVFYGRLPSADRDELFADPRVSRRTGDFGSHIIDITEGEEVVSGQISDRGLYGVDVRTEAQEVYSISVHLMSSSAQKAELAKRVLNEHGLF